LHSEKFLLNGLKFSGDDSDNNFNRETKPCHQQATAAKTQGTAGWGGWIGLPPPPTLKRFRSLWRRRIDLTKESASWQ
jgi:U3 small nucleolar RNA-associated protein 14